MEELVSILLSASHAKRYIVSNCWCLQLIKMIKGDLKNPKLTIKLNCESELLELLTCTRWPVRPQTRRQEGQRSVDPDFFKLLVKLFAKFCFLFVNRHLGEWSYDQKNWSWTWATSGNSSKRSIAQVTFLAWGRNQEQEKKSPHIPFTLQASLSPISLSNERKTRADTVPLWRYVEKSQPQKKRKKATFERLKKHNFDDWVQDGIICNGFWTRVDKKPKHATMAASKTMPLQIFHLLVC